MPQYKTAFRQYNLRLCNKQMITIRPTHANDCPAILDVVESLPEWFDEDARLRAIPTDIKHNDGFVAVSRGDIAGFITLNVADGRLHIGWLGVRRDCRRQGIGSRLLLAAEGTARAMGVTELATVTLGEGVDCPPYEGTRAFYRKHGFVVFQRNKTDNPNCPEEIKLLKRVAQQTGGGDAEDRAPHP